MSRTAPAQGSSKEPVHLPTPGLTRRMACFVYEGTLLFGVLMATGLVYATLVGQHHALQSRQGLQGVVVATLGLYFSWFWSHGGQTLAMKAWRIRLVRSDGTAVPMVLAWLRYVLSWLWFAPALIVLWGSGANGLAIALVVLGAGVVGYAGLTRLHPDRQFWHDLICRTRLISVTGAARAKA